MKDNRTRMEYLAREHTLPFEDYVALLSTATAKDRALLAHYAREARAPYYGNNVYIRGLIEVSNYCKNDCYYCGIRASNTACQRYRLTDEDILECCREGYALGFRTFVLQGGEDGAFTDERLCALLPRMKAQNPGCAITLSLGERSLKSYHDLHVAGADRYLLRHETADPTHYAKLHPPSLSWEQRMECLNNLRHRGYQVGCGFMVGSPFQTVEMLARELQFIESFKPDMCGIGPFIPHKDTPFRDHPAGSVEMTCLLLSCIRLIHPSVLLPATTALGTLSENGREQGILAGANVVMPNLSPLSVRKKYMIYDNKLSDGDESAQAVASLKIRLAAISYQVVTARGDVAVRRKD